jgi:predicted DNA-binding protein
MDRGKNVAVLVTPKERQRLKVLAALEGKTVSSYIRDLLIQHTELANDSFFASGVPFEEHKEATGER